MAMDSTFLLTLCVSEGHHAHMMEWADNKFVQLNKGKSNVLPVRESTFIYQCLLGPSWLGSNYTESNLA